MNFINPHEERNFSSSTKINSYKTYFFIVPLLKINPGNVVEEEENIEELYAKPNIKKGKKKKEETNDETRAAWPNYDEVSIH